MNAVDSIMTLDERNVQVMSKRKELTPFVFDGSVTPLEQENQPIRWFQENWTTNPKKLVKMAMKIAPLLPEFIQRSFTDQIISARYPVAFLEGCFRDIQDWPDIMQMLAMDGNHGMIMDENRVYGVSIKARDNWLKEDQKWNPEDALEIMFDLIDRWMVEHKKQIFLGKIVLFVQFGFDGIPRKIQHGFTDEFWAQVTEEGISQDRVEHLLRTTSKWEDE